jgi:hypothetical protein
MSAGASRPEFELPLDGAELFVGEFVWAAAQTENRQDDIRTAILSFLALINSANTILEFMTDILVPGLIS